jgi:hypothetical protein
MPNTRQRKLIIIELRHQFVKSVEKDAIFINIFLIETTIMLLIFFLFLYVLNRNVTYGNFIIIFFNIEICEEI